MAMTPPRPTALIGFVLDVSGSMQTSVGEFGQRSRVAQLRESFAGLVDRVRGGLVTQDGVADDQGIRVFAFLFGTRIPGYEVLDVLSVLRSPISLKPDAPDHRPDSRSGPGPDGFDSLRAVAARYGRENWVSWARGFLSERDAATLARELERDSDAADELASLLPITTIGAAFSAGGEMLGRDTKLARAKALAIRLITRGGSDSGPETVVARIVAERLTEITSGDEAALPITAVPALWDGAKVHIDSPDLSLLLFGKTPLRRAVHSARDRFNRERARDPAKNSILFILSDGESTDGDPIEVAEELRASGVTVVSCFVAPGDIACPYILFSAPLDEWSDGGRCMFDMSSRVDDGSPVKEFLVRRGWCVERAARLFVQVNQPRLLDDLLDAVVHFAGTAGSRDDGRGT